MAGQIPTAKTSKARQAEKQPDKDARTLEHAAALMGKDPSLSKSAALRHAGITETRKLRRLVGLLVPPAKKTKTVSPPPRKAARQGRVPAAAPLLATTPKKIGAVTKVADVAKSPAKADYQPKTDLPSLGQRTDTGIPAVPDFLAMARPWMALGFQMTAAGFAMQVRMARATMDIPPAATAMRQGAEAFNAWLGLLRAPGPKKD